MHPGSPVCGDDRITAALFYGEVMNIIHAKPNGPIHAFFCHQASSDGNQERTPAHLDQVP